ncbi:CRISPR-associated helicase Cas3 [Gottschalkia acidurici 9a]|uniref:CRISPR-associated helicase Cas3 n=1 Tax=Gottschalkia acidurici (strain ATCC 7906 / DSM 604 / BCRC 14475 / CIP 104303 / KCTC 5404 / NCIMB 10678 / 9a) TaxID=1128398 RepID=K0AZ91_GOTA9|nr:CRISPR-associated helicase/endonuclease Cas3 [Gottschalkia acidurici]AFS77696.1 CRISPR-associated helicase Cas3 [Gottschalkia acidurici 9a]
MIAINNYLAKSNPKETIIEHTDKLIKNFDILKEMYPSLQVNWDMLYKVCLYHDLGKMNIKFQDKIEKRKRHDDEIPHGILSLAFIDFEDLEEQGYSEDDIKIIFHSIAYHHDRVLDYTNDQLEEEIESLKSEFFGFKYDKLEFKFINDYIEEQFFIANDRIYSKNENHFLKYIMIKGLLNRLDYAASGHVKVETKNDFLLNDLNEKLLESWKEKDSNSDWNKLQQYMINHREDNIVVVAQTGMGKTEAGLLWIGDNKGFFTLPLKTAINAIYERITDKIVIDNYDEKVGLLHSDMRREYLDRKHEIESDIDEYYNKTRQLSLPLTVCTIDQIFDFVYRYRGFESKLATLSYSKVVIDEVQMYSPDLLAYLVVGLSYIDKIGGKFAILTATLPKLFVDLLEKEKVQFKMPDPFTNKRIRHSLKVENQKLNSEFIKQVYDSNKVLVICNTVKEAQKIYGELKDSLDLENINLFHSGFIKKNRKTKEEQILKFGNKDNEGKGIWVATQVVEASLDIDFDILVTELSDLNGLFQRMGRCYRDRDWNKEGYNCYVFDGGEGKCTGVGAFIDKEIFRLSKKALKNIDGNIDENKKMELIDSVYTTEKLNGTDYYTKLIDAIVYVKSIESFEKSKKETMKMFRNIHSTTVIPKIVYDENKKK